MIESKNLNKLANYQEGIVASRTIADKPAGTVTFFAFDKSEGLSEHTAPYEAILIVTDGKALITVEDRECVVGAGETITMPANSPHKVFAIERFKMLLIMIK